nr:endonuclease Q family protein [Alkalibacillus aidingensis]
MTFYTDLHVHIGSTYNGNPVKITASSNLTFSNIIHYAHEYKGIDMVGVIDAHSPEVLLEIDQLISQGQLIELAEGGVSNGEVTVLLGSEIEIYDHNCSGPIHVLCFLPSLEKMKEFSNWYQSYVKNPNLSSQRMYIDAVSLQQKVRSMKGLFIPAHVFTPFKSLYGKGVKSSLTEVLNPELIDGVELGLSSDTQMAEQVEELKNYTFLTNSDAHSLEKIGREYQSLKLLRPTFQELKKALYRFEGREVIANYGMNPLLGKYYTTRCRECDHSLPQYGKCDYCGSTKIIKGVKERISELSNKQVTKNVDRPPYIHQVPLQYVPGIGPKTLEVLRSHLYHDMYIIHDATYEEIKKLTNPAIARRIYDLRQGRLTVKPGGGGKYGQVID